MQAYKIGNPQHGNRQNITALLRLVDDSKEVQVSLY